jgi:hypothetical protein
MYFCLNCGRKTKVLPCAQRHKDTAKPPLSERVKCYSGNKGFRQRCQIGESSQIWFLRAATLAGSNCQF